MYANNESAFWANWLKAGEYAIDVVTTLSGVGNILKFGRLYKVLQAGKNLAGSTRTFTKVVTGIKGTAGVAEITSGSVNILLKLTGIADTELGREISKYLFYFEIAALSGEISLALYKKIQASASKILAKEKVLRESVENADEVKQVDDLVEELRRNFKIDNFIARGIKNGKKIGDISKKIIVKELHNVTETATEVSRAIDKNKIKLVILDEDAFFKAIKEPGESLDEIKDVVASQKKDRIYIKKDTPLDKAFGEIIHEGKHALDYLDGLFGNISKLREETKLLIHDKISMKSYVDNMNDNQVIELRARIAEREFQQAAKQPLDFSSVSAMISFIFKKY